ncbi:MAG: hypothetical protein QG625_2263 [Cyanobacteriota bacterium erpe_2018_sw_39hr_WHONDRS-SW48-000098_B_bin.30]|nr:hypothetical protein [Cyanobacteriota bacterium erpe_2018_sw_39hr_WHONDRS-SW48-000098_B_bin.30]
MSRAKRPLDIALLFTMTACSLALCAPPAQADQHAMLGGDEANTQAKILTKGINWQTSLPQAKKQAQSDGRLILWVHMLGNIDGFA